MTYVIDMRSSPGPSHGRGERARRARGRRRGPDGWVVQPPIARFIEPAVLLALRDGAAHGYDLADAVGDMLGTQRVDYGNLYRLLRRMEHEALVSSAWNAEAEGRSKRTYALADEGRQLLDAWTGALEDTRDRIDAFLHRYQEGK